MQWSNSRCFSSKNSSWSLMEALSSSTRSSFSASSRRSTVTVASRSSRCTIALRCTPTSSLFIAPFSSRSTASCSSNSAWRSASCASRSQRASSSCSMVVWKCRCASGVAGSSSEGAWWTQVEREWIWSLRRSTCWLACSRTASISSRFSSSSRECSCSCSSFSWMLSSSSLFLLFSVSITASQLLSFRKLSSMEWQVSARSRSISSPNCCASSSRSRPRRYTSMQLGTSSRLLFCNTAKIFLGSKYRCSCSNSVVSLALTSRSRSSCSWPSNSAALASRSFFLASECSSVMVSVRRWRSSWAFLSCSSRSSLVLRAASSALLALRSTSATLAFSWSMRNWRSVSLRLVFFSVALMEERMLLISSFLSEITSSASSRSAISPSSINQYTPSPTTYTPRHQPTLSFTTSLNQSTQRQEQASGLRWCFCYFLGQFGEWLEPKAQLTIAIIQKMSGISYATFERDFRLQQRLGKGNYATVTRVYHLTERRSYALKAIQLASLEELSQAFNEIETNRCMEDPRIVRISYYYTRENKKTGKMELGMIMELCSSTLAEAIKNRKKKNDYFSAGEVREFVATMVPFFAKMQRHGFLHRDIKPDNILLLRNEFKKTEYKVGDFGFSIRLNSYSTLNIAGTMEYVSPKLLVKFKDNKVIVPGHNFKDDVYSFGKTLYELMTLETNMPVDPKKILQASSRYGPEYCGLLSQMLRENEIERPDFQFLESYAVAKELIVAEDSELKEHYLSISTVNGASSKQKQKRLAMSSVDRRDLSKDKSDYTKTRRKDYDIDSSGETRFETSTTSKANLKVSFVAEDIVKRKVVGFGEDVHSLAICDNLLLVGSESKLGIITLSNEKIVKVKFNPGRAVTCIKTDPTKRLVMVGTLDSRLYCIEIADIKKLLLLTAELHKKKNEIEVPITQLQHRVVETSLPISTFDCYYPKDSKEPAFVVGHCTGELTHVLGDHILTQGSFSRAPITHVAVHDGCVYSSNTDGTFRREASLNAGQWDFREGEGRRNIRMAVHDRKAVYQYQEMLVCFQIIDGCRLNDSIKKDSNKLLAVVLSYDGLAHFISRSFKLEKMVRITQNFIMGATLVSAASEAGFSGFLVDSEGDVFSGEGELLESGVDKQAGCIAGQQGQVFVGGFSKNLTIVSRQQAVKIE